MAFPVGWSKSRPITIDHLQVPQTVSNFYLSLTHLTLGAENGPLDSDGSAPALANGGDLRASSDAAGAVQIPLHVVRWEPAADVATAKAHIVIKFSTVSAAADTTVYLWWGKVGESQPAVTDPYGRNACYNSALKGKWWCNETPNNGAGGYADSTGNGWNGTGNSMALARSEGQIGYTSNFDGAADYISISTSLFNSMQTVTFFGLCSPDNGSGIDRGCYLGDTQTAFRSPGIRLANSGDPPQYYFRMHSSDGTVLISRFSNAAAGLHNDWRIIGEAYNHTTGNATIFLDDDYYVQAKATGKTQRSGMDNRIGGGHHAVYSRYWDGRLQAVAISANDLVANEYTELLRRNWFSETTLVLQGAAPEDAPANLCAVAGDREVTLTWDDVADADSYTVYWGTEPGVVPGSDNAIPGASSPLVFDGTNGVDFYFVVAAVNAYGEGPLSEEDWATPLEASGYIAPDVNRTVPQILATWRMDAWASEAGGSLDINVRDATSVADMQIPLAPLTRDDYPHMDPGADGTYGPMAFGTIYGAEPILIDRVNKVFLVSNEPISAFLEFRRGGAVFTPNNTWPTGGAYQDIAWQEGDEVEVDFVATTTNPADVIERILTYWCGFDASALRYPNLGDSDENEGFGSYGSRNKWLLGTDPARSNAEVHARAICRLVTGQVSAYSLCHEIALAAGGHFAANGLGQFTLRRWEPIAGEGAARIEQHQIYACKVEAAMKDIVTTGTATYRANQATGEGRRVMYSSDYLQYIHALAASMPRTETHDLPFAAELDAEEWLQHEIEIRGHGTRTWRITMSIAGLALRMGAAVRVIYPPASLDAVLEIVGLAWKIGTSKVDLLLSDWRGFGESPGWWTDSELTFPDELGGGTYTEWDDSWSAAQKAYARQNWGFWMSTQGYVWDEHNISVWV